MTVDECVKLLEERGVKDGHLDGLVHDAATRKACAVNNCGLAEQVAFLCEGMSPQDVLEAAFGHISDDELLSRSFAEDRERLLGPPKGRIVDDASALDVEGPDIPRTTEDYVDPDRLL